MKIKSNRGSVLLLTLMVSFLLSLIIAAGLTQKQTSMVSNNAFKQGNRALYLSMRGLHNGMELLRVNYRTPHLVTFSHLNFDFDDMLDNEYYRSAPLWHDPDDTDPQLPVEPFLRFQPPHLTGMALGANVAQPPIPIKVYVSSGLRTGEINGENIYTRKGLEVVLYFLNPTTGLQ